MRWQIAQVKYHFSMISLNSFQIFNLIILPFYIHKMFMKKNNVIDLEEKGDRAGIPVPGPDRSNVERTNVIKSFSGNGESWE